MWRRSNYATAIPHVVVVNGMPHAVVFEQGSYDFIGTKAPLRKNNIIDIYTYGE